MSSSPPLYSEFDLTESLTSPKVDLVVTVLVDPRYRHFPYSRSCFDVKFYTSRISDLIRGFLYLVHPDAASLDLKHANNTTLPFDSSPLDTVVRKKSPASLSMTQAMLKKLYEIVDKKTFPLSCSLAVTQFMLPYIANHKEEWLQWRGILRDQAEALGIQLMDNGKNGGGGDGLTADSHDSAQTLFMYSRAVATRICLDVSFESIPSSIASPLLTATVGTPNIDSHTDRTVRDQDLLQWGRAMDIEWTHLAPQCLSDVVEFLRVVFAYVRMLNQLDRSIPESCIAIIMSCLDHAARAGLFHFHHHTPPTTEMQHLFSVNPMYNTTSATAMQSFVTNLPPLRAQNSSVTGDNVGSTPPLICSVCWSRLTSMDPPVTFDDGESVCSCCRNKKRRQLRGKIDTSDLSDEEWQHVGASEQLAEMFGDVPDLVLNKALEATSQVRSSVVLRREGNRLFRTLHDYEGAVRFYDEALELDVEGTPAIFSNKSAAYSQLKNGDDAVKYAVLAINSSQGKWGKAYFRLHVALNVSILAWKGEDWDMEDMSKHPTIGLTVSEMSTLSLASLLRARCMGEHVYHRSRRLIRKLLQLPNEYALTEVLLELARPRLENHVVLGQPLASYPQWYLRQAVAEATLDVRTNEYQETLLTLPRLLWDNYGKVKNMESVMMHPSLKQYAFQTEINGLVSKNDIVISVNGVCVDKLGVSRVTQLVDQVAEGQIILGLLRPSTQTILSVSFDASQRLGVDLVEPRNPAIPSSRGIVHKHGIGTSSKAPVVTLGVPRCVVERLSRPTPNGAVVVHGPSDLLTLRSCFMYAISFRNIPLEDVIKEMPDLAGESELIDWLEMKSISGMTGSRAALENIVRAWIVTRSQCVEAIEEINGIRTRYERALAYQTNTLEHKQVAKDILVTKSDHVSDSALLPQQDFISPRYPEPPYAAALALINAVTTPPPSSKPLIPASLRNEFDCNLCYGLLCLPATLPCGHSFCNPCAVRAVDHATTQGSPNCPLCRFDLTEYVSSLHEKAVYRHETLEMLDFGLAHVAVNRALDGLIKDAFFEEYRQRLNTIQHDELVVVKETLLDNPEEEIGESDAFLPLIPLHVIHCPSLPSSIVLWDAGERLMIRRAVYNAALLDKAQAKEPQVDNENHSACYGLVYTNKSELSPDTYDANDNLLYGVVVDMDSLNQSYDGGLKVWGTCGARFQVKKMAKRDGYVVGHVKMLDKKIHGVQVSRKEIESWKNKLIAAQPGTDVDVIIDRLIENSIASDWSLASDVLMSVALRKLCDKYLAATAMETDEERSEREPCCESSQPYYVANSYLRFPVALVHAMCFGIPQLAERHFERVRFVLRVCQFQVTSPVRIDEHVVNMLKRHYDVKYHGIFEAAMEEDVEENDEDDDDDNAEF